MRRGLRQRHGSPLEAPGFRAQRPLGGVFTAGRHGRRGKKGGDLPHEAATPEATESQWRTRKGTSRWRRLPLPEPRPFNPWHTP